MLKFNSSENENKINVMQPQNTLNAKYCLKGIKKKFSTTSKINLKSNEGTKFNTEEDKNCGNLKKPLNDITLFKENYKLKNHVTVPSIIEGKNAKVTGIKSTLNPRNPLAEINPDSNVFEDRLTPRKNENLTHQTSKKIPQNLKLNISDLKLKTPLIKKAIVSKKKNVSKENVSKKNSKSENATKDDYSRGFIFLGERVRKLHDVKKSSLSKADREAFEVFNFPLKSNANKQNLSVMASNRDPFANKEPDPSCEILRPLPLERQLHSRSLNVKSNFCESKETDNKILSQELCSNYKKSEDAELKIFNVEGSQIVSPVLGNLILSNNQESIPALPILDLKTNNASKIHTDEIAQSNKCPVSKVSDKNNCNYRMPTCKLEKKGKNSNGLESLAEKTNENLVQNCRDGHGNQLFSCQNAVSPILDSSKSKKHFLKRKCKMPCWKSTFKSKFEEEEISPSPILDGSLFKKPLKLSKIITKDDSNVYISLDCSKSSSKICGSSTFSHENIATKMQEDLNLLEKNMAPKRELPFKKNKSIFNEVSDVPQQSMRSNIDNNEPLSQILDAKHQPDISLENIIFSKNMLEEQSQNIFLSTGDKIPLPHTKPKLPNNIAGFLGNEINNQNSKHLEVKSSLTFSYEEPEPISQILDSKWTQHILTENDNVAKQNQQKIHVSITSSEGIVDRPIATAKCQANQTDSSSQDYNHKNCGADSVLSPSKKQEQLSQILDSKWAQNILLENTNRIKTAFENQVNASEGTIPTSQIMSNFQGKITGSLDINKDQRGKLHTTGSPPLFSNDANVEFGSPVLGSSQYIRNFSEKPSVIHRLKAQSSEPKKQKKTKLIEVENCNNQRKSVPASLRQECNEKILVSSSASAFNKQCHSFPSWSTGTSDDVVDSICNLKKAENFKVDSNRFIDLINVKSTDYSPINSPDKHPKRIISPAMGFGPKFKKLKSEVHGAEMICFGPMLGSFSKSPASDSGLCPNVSNVDEDKTLICSPSVNSELDITKFPIQLADLPDYSPKEMFEERQAGSDTDVVISSQKCSTGYEKELVKENLLSKKSFHDSVKSDFSVDQVNFLSKSKNLMEANKNSVSIDPEKTETLIKTTSKVGLENPDLLTRTNKKKEQKQSVENDRIISDVSGNRRGEKRKVKKNLALLYEDSNPSKSSIDVPSSQHLQCSRIQTNSRDQDNGTIDDEVQSRSEISGIERLETLCGDQLIIANENQHKNCQSPMLGNNSLNHEFDKPYESSGISKIVQDSNKVSTSISTIDKQNSFWRNQFEDDEDICIEDFDEESPLDKDQVEATFSANKVNSMKTNLVSKCEQNASLTVGIKEFVPNVKSLLNNFEVEDQSKNTCEYMSSEESSCDIDIQEDFTQRTSETPPAFRIEYSTSPTGKSSEGTRNEAVSNPLSFPPALEVDVNKPQSAQVLDSACKNRRTRVKRGSFVERLRRLVRAQRAEVNMFHHEVSQPDGARTRVCSLLVTAATQMCSLLMLTCRYTEARRSASQDFGSGEEVVDPEVHLYVEPSFAKNITPGCVVIVFPPWHSVWHEGRGVVVMYNVTKLRPETSAQPLARNGALRMTETSTTVGTTLAEFNCQLQDEPCGCRSQLVYQLFTAPPQLQAGGGGVTQPSGGAVTAALAEGRYPHRVKLTLTVLHTFRTRNRHNQVQTRLLCLDASGLVCQLNLQNEQDESKLGSLKDVHNKTFFMKHLTVCRRVLIDRCKGLRSFLAYLHPGSTTQQMLYVATPSTAEWTAQLIDRSADPYTSDDLPSRTGCQRQQLLSLPISEEVEGRAVARVRVMAVRRDEIFVWEPQMDSYFKLHIAPSAVMPDFPARSCLDLLYLWAHSGELTIDKFTEVSVVPVEGNDSPTIPPLTVDSIEGNLVLLDGVVSAVSSDAYLRWEGLCGHKVLRAPKTGLYFCVTCRQTSASCTQKVVLEVCVAAVDVPYPIRVKVKSETARVFLADTSGQISSEKSYNVIGAIGSTLKCLAIVSEVLKNSLGNIIEFVLEEL